jgi:uncharacterized membrane protein YhaH (DUF805 family)
MLDWMIMPLKRYADFSGRSRRKEYWSFALLLFIVYIIVVGLLMATGLPIGAMMHPETAGAVQPPGALFYLILGIAGLGMLAIIVPSIAVVVRRLHDRDMSGWWYLGAIVASMIPIVGFIASIALFVLMVLPGTPGPNRFGPDPKDPSSAAVFA